MSDFREEFLRLLPSRENVVLFDIGAFDGGDALHFYHNFHIPTIVAIEASQRNFQTLQENVKNTPIKAFNFAVSEINGERMFYDTSGNLLCAGSILQPTDKLKKEHDAFKDGSSFFDETGYMVKTMRLDVFIKEQKLIPNILHIDVQGAEYYVVSSLGAYRSELIYLETSETEHYKESKHVLELHHLLTSMGYELHTKLQWDSLYKLTGI